MSSAVYYRFRSAKSPQRLAFDGTGISVFEIKRGILLAQKLDATADSFQLVLANPDTREVYTDDSEVLPRSSLVEARRLPVFRIGGHDSAAQYVSGSLAISLKNATRRENFRHALHGANAGASTATPSEITGDLSAQLAVAGNSEQDMMNAMFAQQGAQWSQTQQEMATKTKVYTPRVTANSSEIDKGLPPGYICHRCGQKGHWIQHCPSLYDRNWETKKVLRTTGIPKSMLRTVQKPETDADGDADGKTYLMNADGEYVVAVADDKSWQAFQARQLQNSKRNQRAVPLELQDPLTHQLLRDPRATPCCHTVYSYESIESALIQTDFTCPNCNAPNVFFDQLVKDSRLAHAVARFERADQSMEHENENGNEHDETNEQDENENDESDEEYSPHTHKRRRSDASDVSDVNDVSDANEVSDASMGSSPNSEPAEPAELPKFPMFPFMFNPFMLPQVNTLENKEDSDYDVADDLPVVGRIR